jgi:hypothetical protein
MNLIDRDRRFREAADALVVAISTIVRTQQADPLLLLFVLVHRTSPEVYRASLKNGASECGGGFSLQVSERSFDADDPMARLPVDTIACFVSIGEWHKAMGLPLDRLSSLRFERDEEISVWEAVVSKRKATGATTADAVTAADMLIVAAREAASKLPDGAETVH